MNEYATKAQAKAAGEHVFEAVDIVDENRVHVFRLDLTDWTVKWSEFVLARTMEAALELSVDYPDFTLTSVTRIDGGDDTVVGLPDDE